MSKDIRVALVQSGSEVFNLQANLEKVRDLTADAAKKGAKLVLFPEAFISGYPHGCDFGVRVGYRKPEGREEFLQYWNSSLKIPSQESDFLANIAKENQVYLVIGVVEQGLNTLYCSVVFYSPQGEFLGKHRKVMPTAAERVIWGQGDGSTLPVFDTEIGKMGAVICWENYMPLLRTHLYSKGIQIYCAPTADSRESWISTIRHIAMEGRCFVLSCCQYLERTNYPENINVDDKNEILMHGGSCVINPMGQIIAGPVYDKECIITADINLDEVIRGKFDFDVTGHYSRPDIFRLIVNEGLISNSTVEAFI
jgi:nitrilase